MMNGALSASILNFASQHQSELISFSLTLLSALLFFIFRARVKLVWGRANNNFFRVKTNPPPQPNSPEQAQNSLVGPSAPSYVSLYSEKHYVQNSGRVPARDVNVIFSNKPDSISIWQDRKFDEFSLENGSYLVSIPSIAPHELVIIDSLWVTPNHGEVRGVRCADAQGRRVEFWVTRNFGRAFNIVALVLTILGIYYALVLVLKVVMG
ncbi:hypothetical protein FLL57_22595 [Rhodopseudomonas palustris]|uniref:hypothetical protein n=1 Tax=Rhodopseudomonas palustris TaxID=1076 RepID=UPI00115D939C|nr:hypothetical protein [Rhodopseudomonas palustris]QDL99930.1 hypothetical protein FLL57_22595 [Rhodopseudomonas palustris]